MNLQLQEHLTSRCQLRQPGLSEWRKEGKEGADTHMAMCRQATDDGRWSERGNVKKIAVQIVALTIRCQPFTGETWQAGRWAAAVCVTDGRSGPTCRDSRNPDSRFWSLWLQPRPRWHMNSQWHTQSVHTRSCTYTLGGCKVTSPIANYRHRASIRSWGSKLHGSTTTRAMCPGVICQTNYLSWACNCSENRYSGNCVVSCNVKWCFPSIFRRDERSKGGSAEIHGSIWPPSQTLSLKIYATDESQLLERKWRAPWC